jgi:hypothetical protein
MELSHPPAYIDCHYLITAWSPTKEADPTTSPIPDEHEVLAEAMRILMRNPDVVPDILGIGTGSVVFQNAHIYFTAAPPDGTHVSNDFWSTMKQPWRPVIELIATAPLDLLRNPVIGPPVLTLVQRYVRLDMSGNPDEVFLVGGWILRNSNGTPIAGAKVERFRGTAPNQQVLEVVTADEKGRFVFTGLHGNTHSLRAIAAGFTNLERTLNTSSATIENHIFRMI